MDLHLNNKTALITGGSKGIGKAIAMALAREGCNIIICARHKQELDSAAGEIRKQNVEVLPIQADLGKESEIKHLVEGSIEQFKKVDILVNNAATTGKMKTFDELETEDWRSLFEVNLFSVVTLCRLLAPYMKKSGWGRIINISSENGEQPYPDMPHYSVSKGALNNLSKMLSKQYAHQGILVNTVSPAFIRTPLVDGMMQQKAQQQGISTEEAYQQSLKTDRPHIEVERPGNAEEVAQLVAFLASEKASFINGANYRVDGGSVAAI